MSNGNENFLVVYDIIVNFNTFGVGVCKGLAFFYAFTVCDTVSSFYKVGKAKFWAVWLAKVKAGNTTLSNIFKKFSNCPMKSK